MSKILPVTHKVPLGQKASFGAGHFVLNLLPGVLGVYLQVFILTAFGMDPVWAGLLGGLPRIFDALTDPIMGFVSDNTKSRYGRRRPYIFTGAIISGILFILMWQLDENASMTYNFWYVMILQILFLAGNTMFATPLVGLGYEMSPDYNERTRLMSLANSMGQIAWIIVPWLYVIIPDPNTFDNPAEGVRTMAYLVGGVCIIFGILPALFCKGIDAGNMENRERINFKTLGSNMKKLFKGIVQVSKNKPFMKLCGATFLVFNGFQLVAAFSVFIIVFYMYQGSWEVAGTWPAWFNSLNAIITALIVIPIVSKMATKIGKRKAFLIATFLSIVGYILKWWGFDIELNEKFNQTSLGEGMTSALGSIFEFLNPHLESMGATWFMINVDNSVPWLIFLPIPFFAFGMGGLFTLMMSMTADVCDLDELDNGLPRKEGTFGAIYWWMVKVGQALAIILSGVILKIVGFDQNIADQSIETMTNLRIADIIVPAGTAALAFIVMWKYDLDEKRVREIGAALEKRKAQMNADISELNYSSGNLEGLLTADVQLTEFSGTDVNRLSHKELSKLFLDRLKRAEGGLCFSPYTEGQNSHDFITPEQVARRMQIISEYTSGVRSFACTNGNEYIPREAKALNKKTIVGAWISEDRERNELEINNLIQLARDGQVDIAAVGNEVLLRGEITEHELIGYINRVKEELAPLSIPVGYVDTYYQYCRMPQLVKAVDVVLTNCYPFWEGFSIDDSLLHIRQMYALVNKCAGDKEVIITETGWPSAGESINNAIPSEINAMKYFVTVMEWADKYNVELYYFSSFDESWKARIEGALGARWGIWNKLEELKYNKK
ncbi:MAG: MFS transporter [Nonlabens sp.]